MIFKPFYTTNEKLDVVPIVAGQVIFVIDTKKIYFDIDTSTRVEMHLENWEEIPGIK